MVNEISPYGNYGGNSDTKRRYCDWLIENRPEDGWQWLFIEDLPKDGERYKLCRRMANSQNLTATNEIGGFPVIYKMTRTISKFLVRNKLRRVPRSLS